MSNKTAVVILNWNGQLLLEKFLPALLAHTPSETADIIVADNGSADGSVEFLERHYSSVKLILLDRNYGFAGGYNRALSQLEGKYEYAVLLNSDVEVTENWLTVAVDYLDVNPDIAALQPKILSYSEKTRFEYAGAAGGFMDMYGYPFCRGRIFDSIEYDKGQYDKACEIFWASGACMFIRLKEYLDCGGLDEYFFAHQEEIDMCWRLRARGKRIVVLPQSKIYHTGAATLAVESPYKTYLNFRNNLIMLYKNLPQKYRRRVFFFRFFADYLAAFKFLWQKHPANALSIFNARRDFGRKKAFYKPISEDNLRKAIYADFPAEILQKSLLMEYYCLKHKTFNALAESNSLL
jgi:GT2 family glycosyltransferase